MLRSNGGDLLREFTERSYQEKFLEVVPGVWHVLGVGHSNAIVIEGDTSVILVDTLDTLERGQRLLEFIRKTTGKEVKTIIFTHGHPDHRGGAGAFADSEPEIIAFKPAVPVLAGTGLLKDVQELRGARQFGYSLSDEENISQGIGRREGMVYGEHRAFLPPATLYDQEKVERVVDGVALELVRVPGETDDQILVWLPEKKVLCCGDNYYGCFPNLYAIRGSQYRDIAAWLDSLDVIMSYPSEYLLPGHTAVIAGNDKIREVLGWFRAAIDFILQETLKGMNEGKSCDQLAAEIRLPDAYAKLPYLGEHYGCVEWTVRAIYTAYLGWFDGNPTHLHPLAPVKRAERELALMGGAQAVLQAAEALLGNGAEPISEHTSECAPACAEEGSAAEEYQWCLELCDMLIVCGGAEGEKAKRLKGQAMLRLAEYETSANGRHYYLCCAKELCGES